MPLQTKNPNPVDVHAGLQIKLRRRQLNITQTDLGKALGVTFQQVKKYEKGTNRIGSGRLQHIANVLKVTVPYFFEGVPSQLGRDKPIAEDFSTADLENFLAAPDGRALVKAFTRIKSDPLRRAIRNLVEQIGDSDS